MNEFKTDQSYYFVGSINLVENSHVNVNNNCIFLGKFIEYIGYVFGSDFMQDAKARFEFGIISKGYYDKIHASAVFINIYPEPTRLIQTNRNSSRFV
jgi:hypothetical protein